MPRCARCFGEVLDLAVFCPTCQQPHPPDFDQLLNQVIGGRYQIYRRLDKGGSSEVFTAIELPTDQIVVVKFSDPSHLTKRELTYALAAEEARHYWAEMLERMRREAEALTQIQHPNIVRLYDTGTLTDELRYVVMEFLRGRTLREELAARKRLPLPEALSSAIALADALREIHARGIVHRDLNPRNVMIAETGSQSAIRNPQSAIRNPQSAIKLIDFGIAKFPQPPGAPPFTQHSILSGTVAYASPEQCQNLPLDQRADIYSLGIVLYEMVTGERPFTGRTPTEIALNQIQAQPQPPRALASELPLSLEATILRALAKDPAQRQQHVSELADELRAIAQRVVVALPEKPALVSQPLAPLAASAAAREAADEPIFTAYPSAAPRPRRKLAYAAALLLLLTGAAFLAKDRFGNALPFAQTSDFALTATPTATPLSASFENAVPTPTSTPLTPVAVAEPTLPAPEAELAQARAAFALPAVFGRTKKTDKPVFAKPAVQASQPPAPAHATVPAPSVREPYVFNPAAPAPAPIPPAPAATVAEANPPTNTAATTATRPRRQREREREREMPSYNEAGSGHEAPADDRDNQAAPAKKDDDDDDDDRDFAPKVIAWSGAVSGERLIRLEMPGVPGRIEIPRGYRHRVGVVESPSSDNRWRLAVLRVFGRGECSIILRWWPRGRH